MRVTVLEFWLWMKVLSASDEGLNQMSTVIRRDRNHPSIFIWCLGNEEPAIQGSEKGIMIIERMKAIQRKLDPSRPCTAAMNGSWGQGFTKAVDVQGFNYYTIGTWTKGGSVDDIHKRFPNLPCILTEEASTLMTRGIYKTEAEKGFHQSYDRDHPDWGATAQRWMKFVDERKFLAGAFVWTGFDYLGEPSPYDTDSWPNHSSMFGIIDLASLPKDRYYLYRSVWNKEAETLHILPHWTWPGREGEVTPVFVYTNYPTAELFIYGKQSKNNSSLKNRYRLMWMDTKYEPGEVKVVAYDKNGKAVAEKVVRTAGKPHHIELVSNRNELTADGKDLAYVTVKVVDKDGNLCPADNRQINFSVKGTGKYRAAANGDPTNLEQFHLPKMHAFNGMLTAILQAGETAGEIVFTAKANGVKAGNIRIQTK